mgnify:FL=1|tara:strand:- start:518 stop:685 length:168 start_codon:yes stop_codon:yes gene_type:complete
MNKKEKIKNEMKEFTKRKVINKYTGKPYYEIWRKGELYSTAPLSILKDYTKEGKE